MRIPEKSPNFADVINLGDENGARKFIELLGNREVQEITRRANDAYLPWDKFRFWTMPQGVDQKMVWATMVISRHGNIVPLPLTYYNGQFQYWVPPKQQEWLSLIDKKAGGTLVTRHASPFPDDNERYLHNSLMEEAIASSMLEGAVTTREVAKEMLRTNRAPRDKAEQMIVNNYNAILEIREMKEEKLTATMLCHLQNILTTDTLDNPKHAGRFRALDENVSVVDVFGEVMHLPPPADSIEKRIQELCDFANTTSKPFVHQVIKAIALHFMIGFIHPFCDGNGRTARAIFYWYMLKNNYWLFEYLPISRIINAAPAKYARAYLYTENDGGDLTYFNQYHLSVVARAINDLHAYLEDQQRYAEKAEELVEKYPNLNLRQRMMISYAIMHPTHRYTVKEHEGKYRITYNTARADIYGLEDLGLLVKSKKVGREHLFQTSPNLLKQLAN